MLKDIMQLLGLVAESAAEQAKVAAREERKLAREPRRIVQVDTAKDPRYRNARGYGATGPWFTPLKRRRAARPATGGAPRTSAEFRRWRRGGFEVRQDRTGMILAIPVSELALAHTKGRPIPIGHAVS